MNIARTLSFLALLAASAFLIGCAATTDPSYEVPSQLDQQADLQEMHGDILRQNY